MNRQRGIYTKEKLGRHYLLLFSTNENRYQIRQIVTKSLDWPKMFMARQKFFYEIMRKDYVEKRKLPW
jgi:hypothetical protein